MWGQRPQRHVFDWSGTVYVELERDVMERSILQVATADAGKPEVTWKSASAQLRGRSFSSIVVCGLVHKVMVGSASATKQALLDLALRAETVFKSEQVVTPNTP